MTKQPLPRSMAVAGGWGYIGRHFVDAGTALGIPVYVRDPGTPPSDVNMDLVTIVDDDKTFYALDVDFYHLALHPQSRKIALDVLAERCSKGERFLVLNEKPMAAPERPEECIEIQEIAKNSGMIMLFDFLELYDPMTFNILTFLSSFKEAHITEMSMRRSKDREDSANPRNYKVMVPIQYQETVHCLAWVFACLAATRGGLDRVLESGVQVAGQSAPYTPPNPEAYPYPVDGRFDGSIHFGKSRISLITDFTADAPRSKRRTIRGVGDGEPFVIEAEYLEGHKFISINGKDMRFAQDANSYQHVLRKSWEWFLNPDSIREYHGSLPTPEFARLTYLLSAMLWDACHLGGPRGVKGLDEFLNYQPGFDPSLI